MSKITFARMVACFFAAIFFVSFGAWADEAATDATTNAPANVTSADVAGLAANATATAPAKAKSLPEAQIPVFLSKPAQKHAAVNPWGRLILSFFIIGTVGGGMMIFARWYNGKNKKGGDLNKIRILTQFHLGPKKSLAIVRVAGEAILIGVTDHNISMLKSLSLLDGELDSAPEIDRRAEVRQPNFEQTLAQQTPAHDDDDFGLTSIKDKISIKLKDMRPF